MATLSLRDQLRTAQQTRLIAGPHGSQFVHAQFMPMRSTVIECFSPIHAQPIDPADLPSLAARLSSDRQPLQPRLPYTHGRDCQVDCAHLAVVLDSLPQVE